MFKYNLALAMRSLRERPGLSLLVVMTIAVGLGLYTTVQTMAYHSQRVPLPHKSERVFAIQLDNRELDAEEEPNPFRMVETSYQDMQNLMSMNFDGIEHVFTWSTAAVLNVDDQNIVPVRSRAMVGNSEFFKLAEPKFLYGSGWSKEGELRGEAVIVLSKRMNDRLFGGENSVGRSLRVNTTHVRVIGVLDTWHLSYRFYDKSFRPAAPDDFFLPYTFALEQNLPRISPMDCWADEEERRSAYRNSDLDGLKVSECTWINTWAEVPEGKKAAYQQQLLDYIDSQKALGRFPRQPELVMNNLNQLVDVVLNNFASGYLNTFSIIAHLFFAVCLINAVGILLAKFIRRSKEVSLRRALGARKSSIIQQHLIELVAIGLLGGLIGIGIAYLGLQGMISIRLYSSDYTLKAEDLAPLFALDWSLIGQAFLTSIVTTLVVGLYPIWRLCNVSPAGQLKSA